MALVLEEKKIEQPSGHPHGIGFPTVISTAFSQGKGSVMTIEGEQFGFLVIFQNSSADKQGLVE